MKTIKINHIYDHYPLYRAIYGQSVTDRTRDVQEAVIVTDVWVENFVKVKKKTGEFDKKFHVLEMFSGNSSEHEPEFRRQSHFPIASYDLTDVVEHPDSDMGRMLIADLTEAASSAIMNRASTPYDVLLAFYFSGGSFLKTSTLVDPHVALGNLMNNASSLCEKGGLFVLDIPQDPADGLYANLVEDDTDGTVDRDISIYSFNPLRSALGIPVVGGECILRYKLNNLVSRTRSLCMDYLLDVRVVFNGKTVAKFEIKEPFVQVMFNEGDFCRAAQAAGFNNFIFLSAPDEVGNYDVHLDEWLHPIGKKDALPDSVFATKIGFVKG